ncbi:unnamed protein product, partial [Prorocentrum cordatum]
APQQHEGAAPPGPGSLQGAAGPGAAGAGPAAAARGPSIASKKFKIVNPNNGEEVRAVSQADTLASPGPAATSQNFKFNVDALPFMSPQAALPGADNDLGIVAHQAAGVRAEADHAVFNDAMCFSSSPVPHQVADSTAPEAMCFSSSPVPHQVADSTPPDDASAVYLGSASAVPWPMAAAMSSSAAAAREFPAQWLGADPMADGLWSTALGPAGAALGPPVAAPLRP